MSFLRISLKLFFLFTVELLFQLNLRFVSLQCLLVYVSECTSLCLRVCLSVGVGGAGCRNSACSFGCTATRTGPVCQCPQGFQRIGQGWVTRYRYALPLFSLYWYWRVTCWRNVSGDGLAIRKSRVPLPALSVSRDNCWHGRDLVKLPRYTSQGEQLEACS